ncbi:CocE/NonD family hydrolase [Sphingobium algorifonticola]|uniref:CocE/NonD family hydrolase n=2 Tax=Sphingobium algorifonticola TaxID=2008318 RepID=A0A437J686_9SPHN|nr:CocE/NonD family hydrolase [Sphingobium algorifonticola]
MRDGAKLNTTILIRKDANAAPLILDRTPYNAKKLTSLSQGPAFATTLLPFHADLMRAGYIIVLQDVRGKDGSEGDYVMARPLNPGGVDNATDAYDTIDWLVKNVPESNGRVGTIGISYNGYAALMSLIDPHPALRASVPIDPMVDGWKGDDWFHNGAYRQFMTEWLYRQTTTKGSALRWPDTALDSYDGWLARGSAGGTARAFGIDKLPAWRKMAEHPAYDAFWQDQALDRVLAQRGISVPTLLVHGSWDQEDIYGAPALFEATRGTPSSDKVRLVIGPWNHGGAGLGDGASLGPIKFRSDTAYWFRWNVMIPFFDQHLKDGAPAADIAPVTAFETGTNQWRQFDHWPQSCASGCAASSKPLYLRSGGTLAFTAPAPRESGFDEYVSDPAKPVTFRQRPIESLGGPKGEWKNWLVEDQRFAASRPDVLTYVSEVLTEPVRIAGKPVANLFASTSGTDSDWVVKLIDVYPAENPGDANLGGYQLPIAMDVLRGRYRDDPARPKPIPADATVRYRLDLPHTSHVFLPGHRIMVQIQSSWFPLYDRNPQRFVDNIMFAQPNDYMKATQRVFHKLGAASHIELPIAP